MAVSNYIIAQTGRKCKKIRRASRLLPSWRRGEAFQKDNYPDGYWLRRHMRRRRWHPGLSSVGGFEGVGHRLSLFPSRGDVAADGAELLGSLNGAECARDLLLDFDHAEVSLALLVVKGATKVVHKGQGFLLVIPEAVQEVLGGGLSLFSSLLLWWRVRGRKGRQGEPRARHLREGFARGTFALSPGWWYNGTVRLATRHFCKQASGGILSPPKSSSGCSLRL